jgi:hypothetical protein
MWPLMAQNPTRDELLARLRAYPQFREASWLRVGCLRATLVITFAVVRSSC